MKKNTENTRVIFRTFRNGEVIALFPHIKDRNGFVLSYMHIGQHDTADPAIIHDTKPATREEYTPLLNELQSIGYNLEIGHKMPRRSC